MIIPTRQAPPEPTAHEGYDWLYVLNADRTSCLTITTPCSVQVKAAGFDTRGLHWFASADATPVEVLTLFGRQGERAHLRARSASG